MIGETTVQLALSGGETAFIYAFVHAKNDAARWNALFAYYITRGLTVQAAGQLAADGSTTRAEYWAEVRNG